MNYIPDSSRYETMRYNRSGRSGLKLPAVSLGLWHNFGGVDTGATAIAMNHTEADRLGISWRQGTRTIAGTAGGDTPSYMVTLDTVTVGGVTLHNVQAAVIVADTDNDILLGMTFLERTEMREENNALVLRKKY